MKHTTKPHRIDGSRNVDTIDERRPIKIRNRVSIAIAHPTGDKWQSKALFLAILPIVKSVFDCRLPGVETNLFFQM